MFFLERGDMIPTLLLITWSGSAFGAGLFLGPSIQADVIDYDELLTGKRREAQYGAFWAMLPKFVAIPSAAIPIAVLGSLGYVPNAEQSPQVVLAIKAIFALTPAFFSALALVVALRFPIDERTHAAILAGIQAHARGEPATDPLTGERVLPPRARAVDEDTGWFLDHFTPGELALLLARGGRALVARVATVALASLAVVVAAVWVTARSVNGPSDEPGALAVLSIVAAGFALAVLLFHLVRLRQARRLAAGAVGPETVSAWLAGDPASLPAASAPDQMG